MADQRFVGVPLEELRAMAFAGDPESAGQVGQRLNRAAAALGEVSASLKRAADQVGLGWRGRAADAARTGIAGHAHWAGAAAARTATAGGSLIAQADSATYVRNNMPDPAKLPPRAAPGRSPVGTDLARADEAWRNAQLRGAELLDGHAVKSAASTPPAQRSTVPFPTGPVAGVAGAGGSMTGSGTRGPVAARSGTGGPVSRPARVAAQVGPPGQLVAPGEAPLTRLAGTAPDPHVGVHVPEPPGISSPEPTGISPAVLSGAPVSGVRTSQPAADLEHPVRPTWFSAREPAYDSAPRTGRAPAGGVSSRAGQADTDLSGHVVASRHSSPDGVPGPGGVAGSSGVAGSGGLAPPVGGFAGPLVTGDPHRTLGFLLDDDSVFDRGEHLNPVSPPVIGA